MEPTEKPGAAPGQEPASASGRASADGVPPATEPERRDGDSADSPAGQVSKSSRGDQDTSPPPWRVEGMPDNKAGDQPGDRRHWSRFLWILAGLLLLNWILASWLASAAAAGTTVSYSFFETQVKANNVQTITSTANTIQGTFRHQVGYSSGTSGSQQTQVQQFTTERPTFANDNLFGELQANGVSINANNPNQGTPLWEELLLWFGPAILFFALWYWWMRSGAGLGGMDVKQCQPRKGHGQVRPWRRTSVGELDASGHQCRGTPPPWPISAVIPLRTRRSLSES
jgi:hypothetical protein